MSTECVQFTYSELLNLTEFLDDYLIWSIRSDAGVDNIEYLIDMVSIFQKARAAKEKIEERMFTNDDENKG
jgi:hypothetical protein